MSRALVRYLSLLIALAVLPSAWTVAVSSQARINPSASISASISGADGAIVDGDSAVRADVFDLTNSNPLATQIVDANGDAITSFGGGTQVNEDAVASSGTAGTIAMVVRSDTATAPSAAGDYAWLITNSAGRLWTTAVIDTALPAGTNNIGDVDVLSSALPTGAATSANQSTAITALQLLDNIVQTEDSVASNGFSGVGFLAVRQDSHADLAADGDFIPVTVDADGGLRVSIVAGAGSGGTALADDADFTAGTTSFTPSGGFYQSTPTAVTDGDVGAFGMTAGRALKVALSNADGSLVTYQTDASHDSAAINTGPQTMFIARTTEGTAVGQGDAVRGVADAIGRQVILPYSPLGDIISGRAAITDGSSTSVLGAQGAGIRNYLTDVECANSSATDVTVDIRDGTGGSVLWTLMCPAGGGNNKSFSQPLKFTANTAIAADPSASASTVTVSVNAFISSQ